MRNADPSMLLRIAIGDAVAAPAEYLKFPRDDDTRRRVLAFDRYVMHPTHGHAAGKYTDDAEMSVGCARVLVEHAAPYSSLMFADAWVREFNRGGRRDGYARGFQKFLEGVNDGEEFLSRIRPDSERNGAAMRSAVLGVLPAVAEVIEVATLQATVTHDTPPAIFSARAVALMSHFSLYEDARLSMAGTYCLDHLPREDAVRYGYALCEPWDGRPVTGGSVPVSITTVQAAATLVTQGHSLTEILRRCVEWGGDTDSVAAIALGIASPRFRDEALPEWMERDLEPGSTQTGAASLRVLGKQLMSRFS